MKDAYANLGWILALALGLALIAGVAYADTRGSVRAGSSSPSITSPNSPVSFPGVSWSYGISNTTSGTVQSGGNTGGEVETGDEQVEVHVVNVGPTNANTVVTNETEEEPREEESDTPCDSRVTRCSQGVRNR